MLSLLTLLFISAFSVVIMICMALGIALCVLACSVVFFMKYQRDKKQVSSKQTEPNMKQYNVHANVICSSQSPHLYKSTSGVHGSVRYDYAQVWDEDRVTTGDSDYGSQSYYSSRQQHHMTKWDILSHHST